MKVNYHTHTPRCNHAVGTEESYVTAAIERGIVKLGFSDHTPQLFDNGYVSTFRMQPDQLSDYVETISALKTEFANQIELHIGTEAEYYPRYFSNLVPFLQDHGVEYMILGQHCIGNEIERVYSGAPTADEHVLAQYCHQVMDAMQTGLFTYFAHPDVINFQGSAEVYKKHMTEMVREAVQCGLPLEINLLGMYEGRNYPGRQFFEIAAEENSSVIIGIDAHTPKAFRNRDPEERALKLVQDLQLKLLDDTPLVRI